MRTGEAYAKSRIGPRNDDGQPGLPGHNAHIFDALAEAFEAGRKSRENVAEALAALSAKLDAAPDLSTYGAKITNGEVWAAHNAIRMDQGLQPDAPNVDNPTV